MKRTGLKRLECATCPGYAYSTVANLELVGAPRCACGERLHPVDLELAFLLEDEAASPMITYRLQCNRIAHGQTSHGIRGHNMQPLELLAADRVETERRATARARQLAAIAPTPEPLPF